MNISNQIGNLQAFGQRFQGVWGDFQHFPKSAISKTISRITKTITLTAFELESPTELTESVGRNKNMFLPHHDWDVG